MKRFLIAFLCALLIVCAGCEKEKDNPVGSGGSPEADGITVYLHDYYSVENYMGDTILNWVEYTAYYQDETYEISRVELYINGAKISTQYNGNGNTFHLNGQSKMCPCDARAKAFLNSEPAAYKWSSISTLY